MAGHGRFTKAVVESKQMGRDIYRIYRAATAAALAGQTRAGLVAALSACMSSALGSWLPVKGLCLGQCKKKEAYGASSSLW
jgi:hypothetical protein